MTSVTPELGRESPAESEVTTFGFNAKDLLRRLKTEEEFASTFMEQYAVLQTVVKDFRQSLKKKKEEARAEAEHEKNNAEYERLKVVIGKIQEKDPSVKLPPPEDPADDDFFDSSLSYIKGWLKDYRKDLKAKKLAEKQAKADAKAAKEAQKQEKADAKAAKDEALREKLLSQMPKLVEQIDYEPDYDEETIPLAELKTLHARVKMLGQLKKYREIVNDIPDVEEETIEHSELKTIHARSKLINQYCRLANAEELTYVSEKTLDEIKELIKEAKSE